MKAFKDFKIGDEFYDPVSREYMVKETDSTAVFTSGVLALSRHPFMVEEDEEMEEIDYE